MLKDDHKGKLDSQDLPVNWGKESLIIPEASVETFRLKKKSNQNFRTKNVLGKHSNPSPKL